jgi:periplasmic divalent cation tolerance protein
MATTFHQYSMLMTTTASKDDAKKIAKLVLERRLAACVQIFPIESFYTWKGEMANENEVLLLIKTRRALVDEAISEIKKVHPYETPEILATELVAGFSGYLSWIDEVTK